MVPTLLSQIGDKVCDDSSQIICLTNQIIKCIIKVCQVDLLFILCTVENIMDMYNKCAAI